MSIFRRRARPHPQLDRATLDENCRTVLDELAEDFDWRLRDRDAFVRQIGPRIAERISDDPNIGVDPSALRSLLEREISAEYFADLYDAVRRGGRERDAALTELLRPADQSEDAASTSAYRGYLFRAAVFFVQRWTGRAGWHPPRELTEEMAQAAAHEVLIALLRSVELREGRRVFWSFLSRAVERRVIDQLRAHSRADPPLSLDAVTEARGGDAPVELEDTRAGDEPELHAIPADLARMMLAAGLSEEERFSLVAGAHGYSDAETAASLRTRVGRTAAPSDVRRWRFRGREKLRRYDAAHEGLRSGP